MRQLLLSLSNNERFRSWVERFPPTKLLSRRFVAGENLIDALHEVSTLNEHNIAATLDHLGENTRTSEEAEQSAEVYLQILNEIESSGVDSNASLKLTQMGLDVDEELCFTNVKRVVERARQFENFIRIDMESSDYTDRTLNLYQRLRSQGLDNVGVVIQSYLYRSRKDIEKLSALDNLNVRLCKGAYAEPERIAYPQKRQVDQNYLDLLELLWNLEIGNNIYVAVATHDPKMIEAAKSLARRFGLTKDHFEFQMLYGIRRDLQQQLSNEGFRVRVYVSYGSEWYPYFMRRLAERPANLLFLIKNLFRK